MLSGNPEMKDEEVVEAEETWRSRLIINRISSNGSDARYVLSLNDRRTSDTLTEGFVAAG